jgi:hemolysin III
MGWCVLSAWSQVNETFSPWAKQMCILGGVLYTAGLIPWAVNGIEGHNAIWHVFVLAASACFFAVMITEAAQPANWHAGPDGVVGTCQHA